MLNPSIILAGQQPDMVNVLARANAAAGQATEMQNARQYRNALKEFGAGAFRGDENAMAELARFDPAGMQAMQVQRQNAELAQRQEARLTDQHKLALAEYARGISAEQLAREQQATEQAVMRGAQLARLGDLQGANMLFAEVGLPPIDDVSQLPAIVGVYEQARDYLGFVKEQAQGPKPDYQMVNGQVVDMNNPQAGAFSVPGLTPKPQGAASQIGKLRSDLEAGRITREDFDLELQRMAPEGMTWRVGPDGTVEMTQGPLPVGAGSPSVETANIGQVYNPGEVASTLELIDQIMNDPALSRVTGGIQGGGGNDVDQLGILARTYYGGEGLAVIQKINQLQSRSWLAAREMLKGGGPITDYESRKAEAAVARLSRAQNDADFEQALQDLRDAITSGMAKLEQANRGVTGAPNRFAGMTDEELEAYIAGQSNGQ